MICLKHKQYRGVRKPSSKCKACWQIYRNRNEKPRVLVIGDTHFPAVRKGYLEFCKNMYREWKCNRVVHIGDVNDMHAISRFQAHPDAPGPTEEYQLSYDMVQYWQKTFPFVDVCIGNHDKRLARQAAGVNISTSYLKTFKELWGTPYWDWQFEHHIDGVTYTHGSGRGGMYHAINIMKKKLCSVVAGHMHTRGTIYWQVNRERRIFAMNVGCGIDDHMVQFDYGEELPERSFIGCGVVIEGTPHVEPMPIGTNEDYHDSKF